MPILTPASAFAAACSSLGMHALSTLQAQTTTYVLGTTALLVGPAVGSNSVVLTVSPARGVWMATTNATWLHLSPANQSGTGHECSIQLRCQPWHDVIRHPCRCWPDAHHHSGRFNLYRRWVGPIGTFGIGRTPKRRGGRRGQYLLS
jgi:hypothetical protein